MDENLKAYFWKSAVEYSKGDISQLLKAKLSCAGPLLNTTLTGIDNLGGICYGFRQDNSKSRSIQFMIEKMDIPEPLATFIYSIIRCGVVHEGMPKIGLKFFVWYDRLDQGRIFYYDTEGYIWLNVVELAYRYIDMIDNIWVNIDKHTNYIPSPDSDAQKIFMEARKEVKCDIHELCSKIYNKKRHEEEEKYERGEITAISSDSAFTPENIMVSGTYPIKP